MEERYGNHLLARHPDDCGQHHVDRSHARRADRGEPAEMAAYPRREQQGAQFAKHVGEQGDDTQFCRHLRAERCRLELRDDNGGKGVIAHAAAHGEAFRQAPLGETQSGKGGKEERAAHGGQRNKEHLGAKGADNLSQVVAATHAHANLEHQSIGQVERPVVHLLQTADEPAEQATRHKCADHKQTIPHFRPPF